MFDLEAIRTGNVGPRGPFSYPHPPAHTVCQQFLCALCPVGIEMSCAYGTFALSKAFFGTVAGCSFSRADAPNCRTGDIP